MRYTNATTYDSLLSVDYSLLQLTQHHRLIHSFIHTEHLYSASSRELLRGVYVWRHL